MVAKFTSQPKNKEVVTKINEIIDNMGTASGANTDLNNLSETGEAHFGKVKSVNNTSPDSNGNVTISIPSTSGLANTNLSNLSATGKTVLDGQWTALNQSILSSQSLNGSSALNKTVNVPNDGHVYEVLFTAAVTTGTTSGNAIYCEISTNKTSSINICGCRTRASNDVGSRGSVIVPISYASNNLSITRTTGLNGTCTLVAKCYRRVGTNS